MLAGGGAILLALTRLVPPAALPSVVFCPFRRLTGLPCAGCGLTRTLFYIGHGDWGEAWRLNPFGFVLYGGLVALVGWPVLRLLCPDRTSRWVTSRWFDRLPLMVVSAMTAFGIGRLVGLLLADR